MEPVPMCKIIFHLGSGEQVSIITEMENGADAESVAGELWEVVKKGPTWLIIETLAVFTGTVSALEVEAL